MNLTTAQKQALKDDILGSTDPAVVAARVANDDIALAGLYNADAAPDFWAWRTRVGRDELVNSTSVDGTTFSWTGTGYITRSQGERDAFVALFDAQGLANPSRAGVRQAFADIFSGATAPAPANRTHLTTICRRRASRVEKLYATGAGTTAAPGTLGAEGPITYAEIGTALRG